MKLLAFYLGYHDSNLTISDGSVANYAMSERMLGIKHHRAKLEFIRAYCDKRKFKPDAVAFSDGNRNDLGMCSRGNPYERVNPIEGLYNVPTYCIDHHYAHVLSAWPITPMNEVDVGISLDGYGDYETSKTAISKPGDLQHVKIMDQSEGPFGEIFNYIGESMGLAGNWIDYAGKVMGAQAFGTISKAYLEKIDLETVTKDPLSLINEIYWRGKNVAEEQADFFNINNKSFLDWLASVHNVIERCILLYFKKHCNAEQKIVYSGGVAQNTVVNDKLFRAFPKLYIPPHCYDGGLSLGCIEFLRIYYKLKQFSAGGFPYWQQDNEDNVPREDTIKECAKLLAEGKIIGWFQGRGEIGPRALGNRSILMDPRLKDGKEIMNDRVKQREHWRPYAPSVLESEASKWFDIKSASPYMLRVVNVKKKVRDKIPAVVHTDGTSRIHTVKADRSFPFYLLIKEFYKLTGIPMLLNTSLNAGGKPIVSSRKECLDFFKCTQLDALCMGNDIYTEKK